MFIIMIMNIIILLAVEDFKENAPYSNPKSRRSITGTRQTTTLLEVIYYSVDDGGSEDETGQELAECTTLTQP